MKVRKTMKVNKDKEYEKSVRTKEVRVEFTESQERDGC